MLRASSSVDGQKRRDEYVLVYLIHRPNRLLLVARRGPLDSRPELARSCLYADAFSLLSFVDALVSQR